MGLGKLSILKVFLLLNNRAALRWSWSV